MWCTVAGERGSQSSAAYLYSNGGPGVPCALPNGIALYCTTDGNSYLVPTTPQQVYDAVIVNLLVMSIIVTNTNHLHGFVVIMHCTLVHVCSSYMAKHQ